jgi:hypothetical protein
VEAQGSNHDHLPSPGLSHNPLLRERPDEMLDDLEGVVTLEWCIGGLVVLSHTVSQQSVLASGNPEVHRGGCDLGQEPIVRNLGLVLDQHR